MFEAPDYCFWLGSEGEFISPARRLTGWNVSEKVERWGGVTIHATDAAWFENGPNGTIQFVRDDEHRSLVASFPATVTVREEWY